MQKVFYFRKWNVQWIPFPLRGLAMPCKSAATVVLIFVVIRIKKNTRRVLCPEDFLLWKRCCLLKTVANLSWMGVFTGATSEPLYGAGLLGLGVADLVFDHRVFCKVWACVLLNSLLTEGTFNGYHVFFGIDEQSCFVWENVFVQFGTIFLTYRFSRCRWGVPLELSGWLARVIWILKILIRR